MSGHVGDGWQGWAHSGHTGPTAGNTAHVTTYALAAGFLGDFPPPVCHNPCGRYLGSGLSFRVDVEEFFQAEESRPAEPVCRHFCIQD